MCHTLEGHSGCCACLPYKDGLAVAAPIFAGMALVPSLGAGLAGAVAAVVAASLFLTSCCCSMSKGGLVTTALFGCLAALTIVGASLSVFFDDDDDDDDDAAEKDGGGGDDYYYNEYDYYDLGRKEAGVMMAGGCLWSIATILLFLFIFLRYNVVLERLGGAASSPSAAPQATIVLELRDYTLPAASAPYTTTTTTTTTRANIMTSPAGVATIVPLPPPTQITIPAAAADDIGKAEPYHY